MLLQNYPNPFNPEIWIPCQLSERSDVNIRVYNSSGTLVRLLALGLKEAGIYSSKSEAAYWDGMTESGELAANGVYFYTMQAGPFVSTRKMIVLK